MAHRCLGLKMGDRLRYPVTAIVALGRLPRETSVFPSAITRLYVPFRVCLLLSPSRARIISKGYSTFYKYTAHVYYPLCILSAEEKIFGYPILSLNNLIPHGRLFSRFFFLF